MQIMNAAAGTCALFKWKKSLLAVLLFFFASLAFASVFVGLLAFWAFA
jgi:hypothetical protein